MQKAKWLVVAVLASVLCHAQTPKSHAPADKKGMRELENLVANQFLALRKSTGLRPLTRIKNRSQLRQMACTAAVNEGFKQWGAVFYETNDLTTPDPRLQQIAHFDAPQQQSPTVVTDSAVGTYRTGGMPKIERFAVAVWPSKKRNYYWVGVGLYWSAGWEWFDLHLTDDIYYGNEWKKRIAPECGGQNRASHAPVTNIRSSPARRVQLCVGAVDRDASAPPRPRLETLANSLRMQTSEKPSEILLETRTVEIPATGGGQVEGCDYVLGLGNEELRDSCSDVAGETTECRDRQSYAQAEGRPLSSTTRYTVEVWLYESGSTVPVLHRTIAEVYSSNPIISKEMGIDSLSIVERIRTAIQAAIAQSKRW